MQDNMQDNFNENHFEEHKNVNSLQNKKRKLYLDPKQKFALLFLVVLVAFIIVGINFKDKKKYENAAIAQTKTENFEQIKDMENKSNMTKEENNNIKKINVNNIKISTPKQCKEKGLHYIGEIPSTKFIVQSIKLNDGNILIIWGNVISATKKERNIKSQYNDSADYITEYSAEIFNPLNNEFLQLDTVPHPKNHCNKLLHLDNENVLLISENFEIFNIKTKTFKEVGENKIKLNGEYKYIYPSFFDKTSNGNLLQCAGSISPSYTNICWITDLRNFKVKEIYNINIDIPKYLTPANLDYIKINENQILIYTKSYPTTNTTNIYIAIWDINQKKIIKEKEITGIGNYFIALKPIVLDKNRILFFGGLEFENITAIKKRFSSYIYDLKEDKIQEFRESKKNLIIELLDNNLLIFEDNKIKEIFNCKTNKTEVKDISELDKLLIYRNVIQINDKQLLLISKENKTQAELNDTVCRSVWIYTF